MPMPGEEVCAGKAVIWREGDVKSLAIVGAVGEVKDVR